MFSGKTKSVIRRIYTLRLDTRYSVAYVVSYTGAMLEAVLRPRPQLARPIPRSQRAADRLDLFPPSAPRPG